MGVSVGLCGEYESHASSHDIFSSLLSSSPDCTEKKKKMALQMQMPMREVVQSNTSKSKQLPAASHHRYALKLKSPFLFSSPSLNALLPSPPPPPPTPTSSPKLSISMRVASKQAYICRDCGYIYNDRTPFEKLPDKFFCPVCGAPKRRFRQYQPAIAKNANATDARKARKAQIQRDEAVGRALPIAVVIGAAALAGLYFYLNTTFKG
ncbi:uncharacterized protein LOC131159433 [Malania oleifera]|uniref:uncharacterized protein LOC131159433 n=1 Tax=Malania oleifera TaxID=397392 RepID=UPI0025AE60CD|nr:uncharacterized protein LOC131159433 [Malania oleifera]